MSIFGKFSRKEPEKGMEAEHAALMVKWAQLGQANGSRELPREGDGLAMHIGQIRAAYQGMQARYGSGGIGSVQVADLEKSVAELKRKALEQKVKDFLQEKARLQRDIDNLPERDDLGGSQAGLVALSLLLCLSEAVITAEALSLFSNNSQALEWLFLAGSIAIFAMLPHGILAVYRYTEGKRNRALILGALALFIGACFVGMAVMRSAALRNGGMATVEDGKATAAELHWVWIVLLQTFLLFSSTYVASLLRTKPQRAKLFNRAALEAKLEKAEARLEQAERELLALPERALTAAAGREDSAREASATVARIRAMYHEGVSAYMESNIAYRTSPAPACFSEPIPKL